MHLKKKILLVESEMLKPQGHFLDYLIETSNFFKSDHIIIWFLNKNFNSKNFELPGFCSIKKIIKSLSEARGNGTSMITLIIPTKGQINLVNKIGEAFCICRTLFFINRTQLA